MPQQQREPVFRPKPACLGDCLIAAQPVEARAARAPVRASRTAVGSRPPSSSRSRRRSGQQYGQSLFTGAWLGGRAPGAVSHEARRHRPPPQGRPVGERCVGITWEGGCAKNKSQVIKFRKLKTSRRVTPVAPIGSVLSLPSKSAPPPARPLHSTRATVPANARTGHHAVRSGHRRRRTRDRGARRRADSTRHRVPSRTRPSIVSE